MTSISFQPRILARPIRFGNTAEVATAPAPATLKKMFQFGPGGSAIFGDIDEGNKTGTIYVRTKALPADLDLPPGVKIAGGIEDLMDEQRRQAEGFMAKNPGWTLTVKHFDERPANALVQE